MKMYTDRFGTDEEGKVVIYRGIDQLEKKKGRVDFKRYIYRDNINKYGCLWIPL